MISTDQKLMTRCECSEHNLMILVLIISEPNFICVSPYSTQVHLLALVAHGMFRNGVCNEPLLQVEFRMGIIGFKELVTKLRMVNL